MAVLANAPNRTKRRLVSSALERRLKPEDMIAESIILSLV